jgi:endonuclease/exonuclease/phosphatase family metal-dependent hydrolase
MPRRCGTPLKIVCLLLLVSDSSLMAADTFTIATYNLENYLDAPPGQRRPKSEASKRKIRESLVALKSDVLALQEVGSTNVLLELRSALKTAGLDYPHWEFVYGFDTNIHVAVLSRFPLTARRPRTNEGFLLNGRRFRVSRGFADVDVQVNANYRFTLLTAHLKSRREVPQADEADLREQEAIVLRGIIDDHLKVHTDINLVVLGDFNDVKGSKPIRTLVGRGRTALTDTRPAERNGGDRSGPVAGLSPRNITWTYYFGKEDTYSRVDYILLSRGMAREWNFNGTYVLSLPDWGIASDHRPIVADFIARER